jgi:hypothetical protein
LPQAALSDDVTVVARLRFANPHKPDEGGEFLLRADDTVLFTPSPKLHGQFRRLLTRVDQTTLKWGVSLVFGLAAVGAVLYLRDRRKAAGGLFVTAGATGLLAAAARQGAISLGRILFEPQPLRDVRVSRKEDSGNITLALNGSGLRKMVVTIGADEFEAAEGAAFVRAVAAARGSEAE